MAVETAAAGLEVDDKVNAGVAKVAGAEAAMVEAVAGTVEAAMAAAAVGGEAAVVRLETMAVVGSAMVASLVVVVIEATEGVEAGVELVGAVAEVVIWSVVVVPVALKVVVVDIEGS